MNNGVLLFWLFISKTDARAENLLRFEEITQQFSINKTCCGKLMPSSVAEARYFFKSYLKPMTTAAAALSPIQTNPDIFWNCMLFWHELAFFVHTKPVNPLHENSSCSLKTLAVHTNPGKKICGFKNVRIRVNMLVSVTANCEKQCHWRNSMERAFY